MCVHICVEYSYMYKKDRHAECTVQQIVTRNRWETIIDLVFFFVLFYIFLTFYRESIFVL
jgi:hypothetical protein